MSVLDIKIYKTTEPKVKPTVEEEASLGFGTTFSDHMFVMEYDSDKGWHDARIVPFGPIPFLPSAAVFHYGAEVFEGLKAYRTANGKVQLFRPEENAQRLYNSAERLCIPAVDPADFLEALNALMEVEKDWVPKSFGTSLYLRPFLFATDPALGLHTIHHAMFVIIASPSGSYYKEGINPVKIMIETQDVRAVRGGTGYAKCGGNYAAANRAGYKAEQKGYTQVLWLDGVHQKYIEEVGAMNVMFKIAGKIVTPDLIGTVLPGITRKSCIELLKEMDYEVEERRISVDEIMEALENGTLEEMWGTGTAAVVSPVGHLAYKDKEYCINNNEIGPVTQKLYDELTGIQWGKKEDTRNWIKTVK